MRDPGTRVFLDANVIIGAFEITGGKDHFWQGVCRHFRMETVETCVAETQRGNRAAKNYTPVAPEQLEALAAQRRVDQAMAEAFQAACHPGSLDPGELHLLAWLYHKESIATDAPGVRRLPPNVLVATTDKRALKAMQRLGWLEDHAVSLQWLVEQADMMFPLPGQLGSGDQQYTEAWLQDRKAPWSVGEWLPPWPLQPGYA